MLNNEKLILIDIDEENLNKISEKLECLSFVADLTDNNKIDEVMKEINIKFNKIDCLINCAGMWISGDMSKLEDSIFNQMNSLERIKKVIDTNVFGTIAMIKSIFPIMKKQGYGQIININSQSGVICEPSFPIYNATKHSTYAFRKAIQDDLARNNIKITDVCPGLIQTDFYIRANNELPNEITIPSIELRHIKNY